MLLVKLVSLSALNQAVTISRQEIAVIVICISLILEVVLRIAVHLIPISHQAAGSSSSSSHDRYDRDSDYADGVDDAMDEFDEDW